MSAGYPQSGHEKFIYKHNTQQLNQLFTDQNLEMARKARHEMDSVIYNGPYKASYESVALHKTPEWFIDANVYGSAEAVAEMQLIWDIVDADDIQAFKFKNPRPNGKS